MYIPKIFQLNLVILLHLILTGFTFAQKAPYDVFPEVKPPYYRVRYEPSKEPGELVFGVSYTLWIPDEIKTLRGVVVHQHGCGEGSCRSGLSGAYDLHWQALARKHNCALLSPVYEQRDGENCQLWCDPRNGSAKAFIRGLVDLGKISGHPELPKIPWALWGHSGGGYWAGGMVFMYPERVAAAWLRSGVPLLKTNPNRPDIKSHSLNEASLQVPIMCNVGTKEGVTVKDGRFSKVWPANEYFFKKLRGQGGLVAVAIDPLSSHDCGNQRYLAIPWLSTCLDLRLPKKEGNALQKISGKDSWFASLLEKEAFPAESYKGDALKANWLPNEKIAQAWMQYVNDTKVRDLTAPPSPTDLQVKGRELTWKAEADLESGLAYFIIERDGKFLARVPDIGKNRFGRPIFQNLLYSDTPTLPLVRMEFIDKKVQKNKKYSYKVFAVNTVGLKSK